MRPSTPSASTYGEFAAALWAVSNLSGATVVGSALIPAIASSLVACSSASPTTLGFTGSRYCSDRLAVIASSTTLLTGAMALAAFGQLIALPVVSFIADLSRQSAVFYALVCGTLSAILLLLATMLAGLPGHYLFLASAFFGGAACCEQIAEIIVLEVMMLCPSRAAEISLHFEGAKLRTSLFLSLLCFALHFLELTSWSLVVSMMCFGSAAPVVEVWKALPRRKVADAPQDYLSIRNAFLKECSSYCHVVSSPAMRFVLWKVAFEAAADGAEGFNTLAINQVQPRILQIGSIVLSAAAAASLMPYLYKLLGHGRTFILLVAYGASLRICMLLFAFDRVLGVPLPFLAKFCFALRVGQAGLLQAMMCRTIGAKSIAKWCMLNQMIRIIVTIVTWRLCSIMFDLKAVDYWSRMMPVISEFSMRMIEVWMTMLAFSALLPDWMKLNLDSKEQSAEHKED